MERIQQLPHDLLKRIGLRIGHYTDLKNITGVTAFIAEQSADIGIDIRGSNTGTFNTPAFDPKAANQSTHAVVLTGGSTFGLASAVGVMEELVEKGIGNQTRAGIIPATTGAVIYDIAVGTNTHPALEEGRQAVRNISDELPEQGNVGVGTGAVVGKWFKGKLMKGGFGIGVSFLPHDIIVAAFTVTNALGDIINPITGEFYSESGKYTAIHSEFGDSLEHLTATMNLSGNTTLTVIATNVSMTKNQLMKVAEFTHDGYARAIHPIHTNMDGDVVFALSSRSCERKVFPKMNPLTLVDFIGIGAQEAVVNAINNSIMQAKSIDGIPSWR
ncbi:MAG: P1 family peptidase [Candidatus Dojkabacteria bacterium]|nr:MAG: P1 family peptidase [Candidatus Dojkabacteria bacterium]